MVSYHNLNLSGLGVLQRGAKQEFKVSFTPREAKVVVSTAVFTFKEGDKSHSKVVKLSGIGKFPFIELSEEKLNFEQMTVGKEMSKKIIMRNYSLVEAVFSVEKVNDDEKDRAFTLSTYEGKIKPGGSLTVTVKYSPSMVGAITCT